MPAQRDQLLSLVGRVGGKKLMNFVAEIATGPDAGRRKLGIDALSKWPDASVADKLLEIATSRRPGRARPGVSRLREGFGRARQAQRQGAAGSHEAGHEGWPTRRKRIRW